MIILSSVNSKDEVNINKLYGTDATLSKEELLQKYSVHECGLSSSEAEMKIRNLGSNIIKQAK